MRCFNLAEWVGWGKFIRLSREEGTIYRAPTAEQLRVQLGSIEERSLRSVARRAKSARKKNPGDSGRDDKLWCGGVVREIRSVGGAVYGEAGGNIRRRVGRGCRRRRCGLRRGRRECRHEREGNACPGLR